MVEFISAVFSEFVSLTITVLPYFMIGVLVGALLETYMSRFSVSKGIGDGSSGVIKATLLGAILPGCACATIPMARGLKATGVSIGVVSAFIMVSPLLSPHTLVLNYGMLGWRFTVARVVASLAGAIILGLTFNYFEKKRLAGFVTEAASDNLADDSCGCETEVKIGY